MKALVLKGSKREIAAALARMSGEIREAIICVDEPSNSAVPERVEAYLDTHRSASL